MTARKYNALFNFEFSDRRRSNEKRPRIDQCAGSGRSYLVVESRVVHSDKHAIDSQEKPQQQEKARRHYSLKTDQKKYINVSIKIKYFVTLLKAKKKKKKLSFGGGQKWQYVEISDLEVLFPSSKAQTLV